MKPLIIANGNTVYAAGKYSLLGQLRFHSKANMKSMTERSLSNNFLVPNQHILVNLLRLLTINTEWDEERLWTHLENNADRLASLLNFTCIHNNGKTQENVFYKDGFEEHLVILPPQYTFKEMMKQPLYSLCPIIPFCTNTTHYGFVPVPDRKEIPGHARGGFGVLGIDIVQLGIGYYRYLKDLDEKGITLGYDPQAYLNKFPFINATAIHNDLAIMVAVCHKLCSGSRIADMLELDSSKFTILDTRKDILKYAEWIYGELTIRQLTDASHVMSLFETVYPRGNAHRLPVFGEYIHFKRISWVYQLAVVLPMTILLKANTVNGYKTGSVNDTVTKWVIYMRRTVEDFAPKGMFKNHVVNLIDRLDEANKENYE